MTAEPVLNERHVLDERSFVEIVIWRVSAPVRGSQHGMKYRLAFVADCICVVRYDNEAGKGDHRHIGDHEESYAFTTPEMLVSDFWKDVDAWRTR